MAKSGSRRIQPRRSYPPPFASGVEAMERKGLFTPVRRLDDWDPGARDLIEQCPDVGPLLLGTARTANFVEFEESPGADRAANLATFESWCGRYNLRSLPTSPAIPTMFATAQAKDGAPMTVICDLLMAIHEAHLDAGYHSPVANEHCESFLRGLRRRLAHNQPLSARMD